MLEIQLPVRVLLGVVFAISGSLKLIHWTRFHDTFSAMEMFPKWAAEIISRLLPPIELMLGLAVMVGWRLTLTSPLVLALLIGFVAGLGVHRLRGKKNLVCGCFADFERERTTASLILRNLLLAVAALLMSLAGPQTATLTWRDWLLACASAGGAILSWNLLSLIVETVALVRSYDIAEES